MLSTCKMADKATSSFPLQCKLRRRTEQKLRIYKKKAKQKKNCILIMFYWHSYMWEHERDRERMRELKPMWRNVFFLLWTYVLVCACGCSTQDLPLLKFLYSGRSKCFMPAPDFNKHTHSHTVTVSHTRTCVYPSKVFAFSCKLFVYSFCTAFTTLAHTFTST